MASSQSSAPGEDQEYFYEWSKQQIQKLVGVDKLPKGPYKFVLHYSGDDETSYKDQFSPNELSSLQPDKIKMIYQNMVSLEYQKYTVFNDPIHGTIQLHPLLTKITKTRAFDRLKHIKQLAGVHYVYPGATHTRFEHSIGTCYIAEKFARMLQRQQPELRITDREVLCVEIAGLCHDLGHGCFSHLFEKDVLKSKDFLESQAIKPFLDHTTGKLKWNHELMSARIFQYCIWEELETEFTKYGLMRKDLEFIQQLIDHDKNFKDVEPKKRYLFEIVANKATGIDVDKWDYFARDCHYLGIPNEFQWRRLMALSRVVTIKEEQNEPKRIAYRDKEVHNIYGMFRTRSSLHQKAYQHKTVIAVEHMIALAIVKTRDIPLLCTHDGVPMSVSQAVVNALSCKKRSDLDGFLVLTDAIFHQIQCSQQQEETLATAKKLLARIPQRDLFHMVHVDTNPADDKKTKAIAEELAKKYHDNLYVRYVSISYGSETQKSESQRDDKTLKHDPVNSVWFFKKKAPWTPVTRSKLEKKCGLVVPEQFEEIEVRLYSRLGKRKLTDRYKQEIVEAYKKARK